MHTLIISDLHLGHSPELKLGFEHWLKSQDQAELDALYILGDFFDAWIGDDDDSPLANEVCELLNTFAEVTPIFVMRGNRDFLLGEKFAERTHSTLLGDQQVVNLYGENVLLMHGDSLCTQDQEYMQFRAMVRNPDWQHQVLSLPLAQRRLMAQDLRNKSQSMNAIKAEDIMDVTPEEVVKVMAEHKVTKLIHGHTHRPAIHPISINGESGQRWVLGDWHSTGWCIKASHEGMELLEFPLQV